MRHWLIALAVIVSACATGPVDPQSEGARLIRELRQASGGSAVDRPNGFHETGTVVFNGQSSTYETYGDFRTLRWAGSRTIGGRVFSKGFDGQTAWQIGPNGPETDASPAGLANARLETYLTISAYLYPERFPATFVYKGRQISDGKPYDVVTVTPRDGAPMDMWLDVRTHLLRRLIGMDGETPFVGEVMRYRRIDGVQVPFEIRQSAGGAAMAQTLATYEFVDVPPERFLPPPMN